MKRKPVKDRCCMNPDCPLHGQFGKGNITKHSFYKTSQGRRRRYVCKVCEKTFGSTKGTPYYRLHKPRSSFDKVAAMAVEGVDISATARIENLSPDTVGRWWETASEYAHCFNDKKLKGFDLIELQADEIRTFVDTKKKVIWIFTMFEVWSRLWVSYVVGRRSYKNVKELIGDTISRGRFKDQFLFTTDGFEPYAWAATSMLAFVCVYAQVIKKRRKNRVTQVTRKLIMGTEEQLEDCLLNSEDSETINTSFSERHNLTIRRGNSYLQRKTASHAREIDHLDGLLDLQMCHYNFIRPHSALKFGKETRTPAMQAGIVSKKLSFRDIFTSREVLFLCLIIVAMILRQIQRKKLTNRIGWSTLTTLNRWCAGIPMVTMGCVSGVQRFLKKGVKHYDGAYRQGHLAKPDDLIIATRDVTQKRETLGSPAMIPRQTQHSHYIVATNLYRVVNQSNFSSEFLYQLMRTRNYREQIIA